MREMRLHILMMNPRVLKKNIERKEEVHIKGGGTERIKG